MSLGPAYRVTNYDPCVPQYSDEPEPHPIVVCGDVMEHVEPEYVDAVLEKVRSLTTIKAVFIICLAPALKHLDDGRNAHLSIHPQEWWADRLEANGFTIDRQSKSKETENNAWFIVS